jgi:hypothetical protein
VVPKVTSKTDIRSALNFILFSKILFLTFSGYHPLQRSGLASNLSVLPTGFHRILSGYLKQATCIISDERIHITGIYGFVVPDIDPTGCAGVLPITVPLAAG